MTSNKSGKSESKKKSASGSPFDALKALKTKLDEEERQRAESAASGKNAKPGARAALPQRPPAPPPKKSVPPGQTEDEALSFHRLMSGVRPLDRGRTPARIPKSQQALEQSPAAELALARARVTSVAEAEAAEVHAHLRDLVEGKARFEISDDGRRVEGRRVDLPQAAVRNLRRGTMPIDGRADLHGLHAGDARKTLEAFLSQKRALGERCVLVIHGKGEHSPRGDGVLRGEIAAWLSQGAASEHVAAFATALPEDGGEGAVYVLLRK